MAHPLMEKHRFKHLRGGGDAVILVPPFAGAERPSLGAHILQACCAQKKLRVKIVYANLAVAREVGEDIYSSFWDTSESMFGEQFFSSAAFGRPLEDGW